MNNKSETVHFSIEGEFLTDFFRNICLEGNWSKAINLLQESLIGFPMDLALKVLSGEMKLVGLNNIYIEEDLDSEDYKKRINEMYGKNINVNGTWYQPSMLIETIKRGEEFIADRARIYDPGFDTFIWHNNTLLTLNRVENYNPPIWIEKSMRTNYMPEQFLFLDQIVINIENYKESQSELMVEICSSRVNLGTGELEEFMYEDFVQYEIEKRKILADKIKNEIAAKNIEKYRKIIIEQANEKGGFLTIKASRSEAEFNVPKIPFLMWCLKHGNSPYYLSDLLPEWDTVSPCNLKMLGDDPIHSDWVIGAGFEPEDFYHNDKFKNAAYGHLHKVLNLDMITLAGKGTVKGTVIKANRDLTIEEVTGKILVLPHAGVEYFELAKVALATICEVGGPGSHLAVNSSEFNIKLCLIENAMKLINDSTLVLDLDNNEFKDIRK